METNFLVCTTLKVCAESQLECARGLTFSFIQDRDANTFERMIKHSISKGFTASKEERQTQHETV